MCAGAGQQEYLLQIKPRLEQEVQKIGEASIGLQLKLKELLPEEDPDAEGHVAGDLCCGSDTIISVVELCLVRDNLLPELKYMLASIILPLFYIVWCLSVWR